MKSELGQLLSGCRNTLIVIALFSGGASIFALTGALFLLTVYDRVIPSGSLPTLVALGLLALVAYGIQWFVEIFRGRLLTRIGLITKEALSARSFDTIVRNASTGNLQAASVVRDIDQIQGFMASMGPVALFDLPWMPIFVAVCFAFHPAIGITVTLGALTLVGVAILSNALTREPIETLNQSHGVRASLLAASQAHAETIQAMGMTHAMAGRWSEIDGKIIADNQQLSDLSTLLGSTSRVLRMILQSLVLAIGAFLVIRQEATGGIIIASSILSARALAPIDQSIAHWKNIVSFRQSWQRLDEIFKENPVEPDKFEIPLPSKIITCEHIALAYPNSQKLVLRDVSFSVSAGDALGVVGPTGSGKSALMRALVGLWRPYAGEVRFDGQQLSRWSSRKRGQMLGYLPQNFALFNGTIAENIARFDPNRQTDDVIEAAKISGAHDLISQFSDGYDTLISESGGGLSGGQAQRIALARALYGNPFVVLLDEPNSHLDAEGEAALQAAIVSVKRRGGVVIIVAHRPSVLSVVDDILALTEGRVREYGAREEVIQKLSNRPPAGQVTIEKGRTKDDE